MTGAALRLALPLLSFLPRTLSRFTPSVPVLIIATTAARAPVVHRRLRWPRIGRR
jgi:hypothetical protein